VGMKRAPTFPKSTHGTRSRHVQGCRCDSCRAVNTAAYHDRKRRSREFGRCRRERRREDPVRRSPADPETDGRRLARGERGRSCRPRPSRCARDAAHAPRARGRVSDEGPTCSGARLPDPRHPDRPAACARKNGDARAAVTRARVLGIWRLGILFIALPSIRIRRVRLGDRNLQRRHWALRPSLQKRSLERIALAPCFVALEHSGAKHAHDHDNQEHEGDAQHRTDSCVQAKPPAGRILRRKPIPNRSPGGRTYAENPCRCSPGSRGAEPTLEC